MYADILPWQFPWPRLDVQHNMKATRWILFDLSSHKRSDVSYAQMGMASYPVFSSYQQRPRPQKEVIPKV